MTDTDFGFLARKRQREASRELTQLLVLGYGAALIMLTLGAYKYYLSIGAWDALWKGVLWAGAALLVVTAIAPHLWRIPERFLRRFGNWLGQKVMHILLSAIYFLMVWPIGVIMRATRGADPLYEWDTRPPDNMEGWHPKKLPYDLPTAGAVSGSPGRVGFFKVLTFFVRRGHMLFLPVLIILVALGVALFFLQTSALAPFIYTLF